MKRHILKYVGGSRDGWSLDTDSSDEQERFQAASMLDMTKQGTKGWGHLSTTDATRQNLTDTATAEKYVVTNREETDGLVIVTLTYQMTKPGRKRT